MEDVYSISSEITDQSISAVHHSLRASRRRLVVILIVHYSLPHSSSNEIPIPRQECDLSNIEGIPVRQLAKDIVSVEEDVKKDHSTGPAYRSVYNSLVQTHLPHLGDVAAIRFDEDRKIVWPGRNTVALAIIAAVTSPLAQKLFHAALADLYAGGPVSPTDSIGD